ncbi:50S ribosomal protein L22 [Candidatus Parcubacteria bacterium]|nr:50S ribosomal protein L22 [Candidatus Parcubacteria bacterium]
MAITAKLKYLHIAPRKVRLVTDLIRGKRAEEAQTILNFSSNRASQPLLKLLKSCIANAKNNFQIEQENLYVSKIFVDEGPKLKRWHAQSRGRAAEIQKKSSHICLEISEIKKKAKKVKKVAKTKEKIVEKKPSLAEVKEGKRDEEAPKIEKPRTIIRKEKPMPKIKQTMKRVFRRKAF